MRSHTTAGAAGKAAALPQAPEVQPSLSPTSACHHRDVIAWMAARAVVKDVDERDLEVLASAAAAAENVARRASRVADAFAFMVLSEERSASPSGRTGCFDCGHDLSDLLKHFGDVFGLVAGLINVSEWAALRQQQKREEGGR